MRVIIYALTIIVSKWIDFANKFLIYEDILKNDIK